ncbi:MAG: phosphatase PAP2 family protein, partial [Thermoplasmata archaeon]
WLWDKRLGLFLIVLLLVSGTLNAVLKAFFGLPRPPAGLHKTVPPLTGNGFPSGHAQTSTAFWSAIALISRGWWILLAVAMITLVAFSRVYLGVHFVGDVLGGVAIGLGLGVAGYVGFRASFWGRLRVPQRLVLAVVLPAAFSGVLLLLGEAAYLFWGLLTGLGVGYVLEEAWVGMERARTVGSALLRVAIGIPAVGGLALLGMRFSDPMIVLPLFLVLGFAVSLVLPWAFLRLEKALSTNR